MSFQLRGMHFLYPILLQEHLFSGPPRFKSNICRINKLSEPQIAPYADELAQSVAEELRLLSPGSVPVGP
jgi:hypothetical protein